MKPSPESSAAQHASATLHPFKLLVLKMLLSIGTLAILLIWPFEIYTGRLVWIDAIAYPIILTVCLASLALIQLRPKLLGIAEHLAFFTFASYMIVQLQSIIFGFQQDTAVYSLATLAQWFPLVYTTAFIFFDARRAMIISAGIYLSFLIPIIYKLASDVPVFAANDGYPIMLNILTAHPVYIVTLTGITRLKSHFVDATADASLMSRAANIDYLTGVMNRRAAAHELQVALAEALRSGQCMACLLIDIDHFKQVNDRFGHDVGDEVLIAVAAALREQLRAGDLLGRWGGEEFIVLASHICPDESVSLAERLRGHIAQLALPQAAAVTLSIGVAGTRPGDTPEALVKRADEALYRAKQLGRNRIVAG